MRNMTGAARIPLDRARNHLAKIWLTGAGIVFLLLVIQSILGKYEGQLQEVWSWFVPTVVPTIALMLGVLGASALAEHDEARSVNKPFWVSRDPYRFSIWACWPSLSFFSLLVISLRCSFIHSRIIGFPQFKAS
jgi:hypothetical protein